jgi:hypothetical protein
MPLLSAQLTEPLRVRAHSLGAAKTHSHAQEGYDDDGNLRLMRIVGLLRDLAKCGE